MPSAQFIAEEHQIGLRFGLGVEEEEEEEGDSTYGRREEKDPVST